MKAKAAALLAVAASTGWVATVVPAARACRYCEQAAGLEAPRFMREGRPGGSFPLDGSLNRYASDPVSAPAAAALPPAAEPKTAPPDPAAVATNANALPLVQPPVAPAATTAPVPVSLPTTFAPTPKSAAAVAVAPAVTNAPSAATSSTKPAVAARWADFGLLGLLGVGGFFAWRTRAVTPRPAATA